MPTSIIVAVAAAAAYEGAIYLGATAFVAAFAAAFAGNVIAKALYKPLKPTGDGQARTITIRQAAAPWQRVYGSTRVGGVLTFYEADSVNAIHWMVITLASHASQSIDEVWANDEVLNLAADGREQGKYFNSDSGIAYIRVLKSLGDEAFGTQPFPQLVGESAGKWTSAHRQDGHTKIAVRLVFNQDLFPNGIPNFTVVMKGKKLYDPRSGLTAWSANAALAISDYLTDAEAGLGCVYADEINNASLVAAANSCDEAVSLAAGGTEARYTCNGAFTVDAAPRDILGRLNTAYAGPSRFLGGQWSFFPAVYNAPTAPDLTVDDLRGPVHIVPRLSRRDVANGAKGVFVSPLNKYQETDFPAVAPAAYLAEDGNERIWLDLSLPFTNSSPTAQRIAKIELERLRRQQTLELPCKLSMYRHQPGDVVPITLARYGYASATFECMNSKLSFEPDEEGVPRPAVDLVLRETAAAVFAWTTGDQGADAAAPASNLPDVFTVDPPGTPSAIETLYVTTGSAGVKSRATVSWAASADQFVQQGGFYELEYRIAGGTYERISPITGLFTTIDDLVPGLYELRVRAVNVAGVRSAYTAVTTKELYGLTAPPSDLLNFAVQSYSGQAKFTWQKPSSNSDLDVVQGGRIYVRWSPLTAGATWDHGSLVNPDGYPGDTSIGFGPLMTGTYMAKACDSSGNYSVNAASFVVTEALITGMTTIATVTESPAFAGAKSNVAAVDGWIQLDGTTLIDSILTLMDDWGSIDSQGGVKATGTYTFFGKLDLGSKQPARLFATIGSLGYDVDDLIDSRTNNIDDWGLMDGVVVEDAEVQLMVRTTDDDPNGGSPAWSAYHALGLVADYNFRGFDFRLDFATGNATHNRAVTSLSVAAKH